MPLQQPPKWFISRNTHENRQISESVQRSSLSLVSLWTKCLDVTIQLAAHRLPVDPEPHIATPLPCFVAELLRQLGQNTKQIPRKSRVRLPPRELSVPQESQRSGQPGLNPRNPLQQRSCPTRNALQLRSSPNLRNHLQRSCPTRNALQYR